MKRKLFTLLLLAAAGLSLFISCSAAPEAVEPETDGLAYVRFGEETNTRSFTATYDIQDYDNLYWFYTATKDDDYGKTGVTVAETAVKTTADGESTVPAKGLDGTIGPFSQGNWNFTLKAYANLDTDNEGLNLVYENEEVVSVTLRGGETKSISVTVKAAGETGLLSFRELSGQTETNKAFFKWADGASTSSTPYFTIEATNTSDNTLHTLTTDSSVTGNNVTHIVLGAYDDTAKGYPIQYLKTENGSSVSADISLPVGYYSCRIYAYCAGETAEKNLIAIDKSFAFRIYGSATTVVTGDLTEKPNSYVTFDVPEVAIVQVVPDANETATTVEASVAPQKSTDASVTAKTEVSIPNSVLDTTGNTSYSLEVSSLSENTASNSFTVSAADSTGTAKIYGSVSLSLNAVKDNKSEAVKEFASPVTVSVFIGKGLSDVTIKYVDDNGTEADENLQPTVTGDGLGYNSETGMFTFQTSHFSTFVVASTKSAVVRNVSNGKLYNTLNEAISALGDTSELKLLANLSDNIVIALADESNSSLVIDLDSKEVKNISLDAKSGSITLKNGAVSTATVKSGNVTFQNVNSENVSLDKDYDGVITFEGGTLKAGSGEAAFNVAENKMTDGKAPTYIFRNVEVTAGSKRGIKIVYAKSITVHNCTFDGSSLSSTGEQPTYITRSLSALDIAVYTPDVDISIIGNTFKNIPGAEDNAETDTAAAIKIKSGNGGEGKVGSIGNVIIKDNSFNDCVRDVTIGKADTSSVAFSSQTKSAIDSEGNVLSGWTISGNTSDNVNKEELPGVLVYTDASNAKISAKIGQVVGGCTVYDISTAYEARIGERNYLTLSEAINEATVGSTVELLRNASGSGLMSVDGTCVRDGLVTIDFKNYTYTMNDPAVGSNGTETQAMHWGTSLKAITLKNGTFKVAENAENVKMAMQNYITFKAEDMTFDFTSIPFVKYGESQYTGEDAIYNGKEVTVFNNNKNGTITLESCTVTMNSESSKGICEDGSGTTLQNSTINGAVSINATGKKITTSDTTITKGVVANFEELHKIAITTEDNSMIYTCEAKSEQ